jgi:peptidoglycan/LPS O-acetylase OafA/YrhL
MVGNNITPARSARVPSLDGLRAVSAAMVVFGHAVKLLQVGRHLPYGAGVADAWGPVGVTVFFVISGFLITRLLIEESRASGSISFRGFFARRAFRILPAYWTYLAVVAALASAGLVTASALGFSRAFFFSTDYLNSDSWVLNHSWSLSVEEQFYLFWPVLLLVVGTLRARKTALALIVVAPALRVLTYFVAPDLRPCITSMLHLRVDALMVGCWAALEMELRPRSRWLALLAHRRAALISAVYCILVSAVMRRFGLLHSAVGYSIEAFCACAVLLWAMRNGASRAGRVLNSGPMVHLGAISYSLYLWQQLWFSHEGRSPVWIVPLLIAGAVISAELSYRFVEAPMLRLRTKLRVALPGDPGAAASYAEDAGPPMAFPVARSATTSMP